MKEPHCNLTKQQSSLDFKSNSYLNSLDEFLQNFLGDAGVTFLVKEQVLV